MNPVKAPLDTVDRILLAHGGGGELTGQLIQQHLLSQLNNKRLAPLTDGAVLPWKAGELVFTTDSYVVTPLEFPGGDIGRIAVAGTVNDLSVMGATPVALSLGLILEEGLPLARRLTARQFARRPGWIARRRDGRSQDVANLVT